MLLVGVGVVLVGAGVDVVVGVEVVVGLLVGVEEVGSTPEVGSTLVGCSLDERLFFLDGVGAHPAKTSARSGIRIVDFLICI